MNWLQFGLRDAMAGAIHAALSDADVSPELYTFCHFTIYPLVVHDAVAGELPDDPQEWFRQRLQAQPQNTDVRVITS